MCISPFSKTRGTQIEETGKQKKMIEDRVKLREIEKSNYKFVKKLGKERSSFGCYI